MPGKCSICTHENVTQMESLADSGESIKAIAEQFNVSRFSLSRHINHHRNSSPAAGSASTDLEIWLSRANDEYLLARADADSRAAIQALIAGLRAVEAREKQAERDHEAVEEDKSEDSCVSIGSLDEIVSMLTEVPDDPVDRAKLKEALARARALNRPDAVAIFFKMTECNEFAEDLATYAATWQPPTKGEAANDPELVPQTTAPN